MSTEHMQCCTIFYDLRTFPCPSDYSRGFLEISFSLSLKLLNWKKMNQNYSQRLVEINTILTELF